MFIETTCLDRVMKAHEEYESEHINEKRYQDGMRDARKLLKQAEQAQSSESYWFNGTNEIFCHICGKGVRKPRRGDKFEFCPHCGRKMK